MRQIWILAATLALLAATSCSSRLRRDYAGGGTPAEVQVVQGVDGAKTALEDGAIVFDLRSRDEWEKGHLPRARLVEIPDLELGRGLPEDLETLILYYGAGPSDTRPKQAAEIATGQGYVKVMLFRGGWRAWRRTHPVAG